MPVTENVFTRIWRFVDHKIAGSYVLRSDMDVALDDIADGINQVAKVQLWDASGGSFPAGASASSMFRVSVAGTVDGVTFSAGDLLIPIASSPSTSTFDANWVRVGQQSVLSGVTTGADARAILGVDRIVENISDLIADAGVTVGTSVALRTPPTASSGYEIFDIVAAATYTANPSTGKTVFDLTGISGQAVSRRRTFKTYQEMKADTRTASYFAASPASDTENTIFMVPGIGALTMALSGASDNHIATDGGVKLYITGRTFYAEAFGIAPSGTADNTPAWNDLWAAVTAAVDANNLGGPPTVILPRGIIRITSTITVPRGVTIKGQGSGKNNFGQTDGTWIVAVGTQSIFYTGFALNSSSGKCTGVIIRDLTLSRDDNYMTTASSNGLLHGHQAIEWRISNVRFRGGYTPCVNFTDCWDTQWDICEFLSGGTPDGLPAVNILTSTTSGDNSNYNQFFQCRWERTDGPMCTLEGLHHSIVQCKIHATSNNNGTIALPAFKLPDSTIVMANGFANHSSAEAATKCSVIIQLSGGESVIEGNVFRNNDTVALIEITGATAFAQRHVIRSNTYDGYPTPAILDSRTAGGAITLGENEWALYEGTPAGVTPPNSDSQFIAGGDPEYAGVRAYFEQADAGAGPALMASYSNGSGANAGDVAAYLKSGNYQRPVVIIEQTRTTGSTLANLELRHGLTAASGRVLMKATVDISGTPTETFKVWLDGGIKFPTFVATDIASAAHWINTVGKEAGKTIFDGTNGRLMVATGPNATDPWVVADGSATVTPA